jgi:hypothetical protein
MEHVDARVEFGLPPAAPRWNPLDPSAPTLEELREKADKVGDFTDLIV